MTALRRLRPDIERPFSTWAYPLPSVVAAAGWMAILLTSGVSYIAAGVALLAVGIASYLWRARRAGEWPFTLGRRVKSASRTAIRSIAWVASAPLPS